MKRCLLLSLLLILGLTNVMVADISQVPLGVLADDPYIVEFMKTVKTNKVRFKDGTLKIYADPSAMKTVGRILLAFGFGALGLACLGSRDGAGALCGVICGALAVWAASLAIGDMQQTSSDSPYVVLNNDGIKVIGKAKLAWEDLAHLEREKTVIHNEWGTVLRKTQVLSLQDKFRTTQLSISDVALPITFDNFVALVEHYWQCNTKGKLQVA